MLQYDSNQIAEILPHRYPFALVDRILDFEPGKWAIGRKCVTRNEEFFCGHFPGQPVMPGVLILEALAQTLAADLKGEAPAQPQEEAPAAKPRGFVCKICGFIYESDTLPADFTCPICRRPASDFEPLA